MKTMNQKAGRNSRLMALAIVMLACATISNGQVVSQKSILLNDMKERILHRGGHDNLFRTVSYYENEETTVGTNISRTIYARSVDVIYEDRLLVEAWMTVPFNVEYEEAVKVENWMTAPFKGTFEESVEVEGWMTAPFEAVGEAELEVEEWMTRPFGSAVEDDLAVEDWMTQPFEVSCEDFLAVEEWMTQPFELSYPAGVSPDNRIITYLALAL